MTRKTLIISAAVAAVLVAAGAVATNHIGQTIEREYNAWVDRSLEVMPYLEVEERRYERGLFSAVATLVVRMPIVTPKRPDADSDADTDSATDSDADARAAAEGTEPAAAPGSDATAAGSDAAGPGGSQPTPAADDPKRRTAFRFVAVERIRHGPFPGSLMPAAARTVSTVTASTERADGERSAPVTVLTADSKIGFDSAATGQLEMPPIRSGDTAAAESLDWAGLKGRYSANLATYASTVAVESPGLVSTFVDNDGRAGRVELGPFTWNGTVEPSPSPWTAPSRSRIELTRLRVGGPPPADDAEPVDAVFEAVTGELVATRAGDQMTIGSTWSGRGRVGEAKIEAFDYADRLQHVDAADLEALARALVADYGSEPDPAVIWQGLRGPLGELIANDPRYSIEKFTATVDGEPLSLGLSVSLSGASAAMIDKPMALASHLTASLDLAWPRSWLTALEAGDAASDDGAAVARFGALLEQGRQLGFVEVGERQVTTRLRFDRGNLEVNGRPVFRLPPSR